MKERGFTLVELVITVGTTALLIGVIVTFMTNSIAQYAKTESRASLLNEAQIGLDVIGSDIRLSGNADTNNRITDDNAPGAPDDLLSWESDQDTLILATAVEDSSGSIIFADPALYISQKNNNIYYLSNGSLFKRTLANEVANNSAVTTCPPASATQSCPADKKLLNNVATFTVKYFNDQNQEVAPSNARSIELFVKLEKTQYNQPISVEYSTRMVFRND
jgi:Tfp pilus assembly protein PilW